MMKIIIFILQRLKTATILFDSLIRQAVLFELRQNLHNTYIPH